MRPKQYLHLATMTPLVFFAACGGNSMMSEDAATEETAPTATLPPYRVYDTNEGSGDLTVSLVAPTRS